MLSWSAVGQLLDAWTDVDAMRTHGVQLLAAGRLREHGYPVPPELAADERSAAIQAISAPYQLERIRSAVAGPLIVMKGPDLAVRFPDPRLRPYSDIDLLAPDAPRVHQALVASRYRPVVPDPPMTRAHHFATLRHPDFSLDVEVHAVPRWVHWQTPPPATELFRVAVPSPLEIEGLSTLAPSHYALVLAAHAWQHGPLSRLLQLIDYAVVAEGCRPGEIDEVAVRWGLDPVVRVNRDALAALFEGAPVDGWIMRRWIDQLREGRERSSLEYFLAIWMSGMWAPQPRQRLPAVTDGVIEYLRPRPGLSVPRHALRLARRMRRPWQPVSEYYDQP